MLNQRRSFFIGLALLAASTCVQADDVDSAKKRSDDLVSLDFRQAFPKPIYSKSYFGLAITATTIVGAGAFTYFTAGAGAPAAATGVSTVASWVAGGGAGSYMAGLSTIGGWFGGNAMLGSAILNGISIGAIGGGTGALSAMGKASVAASMSATMQDGVALFSNPATGALEAHIKLMVPRGIGSREIKKLAKDIGRAEAKLQEAHADEDTEKVKELIQTLEELKAKAAEKMLYARHPGSNPEDLIVLSIMARNDGQYDVLYDALESFGEHALRSSGYLAYLRAVSALERDEAPEEAQNWLETAMLRNDYALEPALLMINVLDRKGFADQESAILGIVQAYEESFSKDAYQTPFSMVSMHYRVGTLYLRSKQFEPALDHFTRAHDKLKLTERLLNQHPAIIPIALGQANALYGMKETARADALFDDVLEDVESEEEAKTIKERYAGYLERSASTL